MSDPAAWKCDVCRKSGLEKKRRCGFLPEAERGVERVVWVRGNTAVTECPTSYVTPHSWETLERFSAWKTLGGVEPETLPAKLAEALMVLEAQWQREKDNGQ